MMNNRYASGQAPRVGDVAMCVDPMDGHDKFHMLDYGMIVIVDELAHGITDDYTFVNDWEPCRFYFIGRL